MSQRLTKDEIEFYLNDTEDSSPSKSFKIKQGLFGMLFKTQRIKGISNEEMAKILNIKKSDYDFIKLNPDSRDIETYINWLEAIKDEDCMRRLDAIRSLLASK